MSLSKGAIESSNQPSISLSDDNTKSSSNKSPSLLNQKIKREKIKTNRESCAICRDGGDLLLCDNCPKSFHLDCLKLKKNDIPEGSWYCPTCLPKINRRKETSLKAENVDSEKERKRILKNEKRRLWRLKRKALLSKSKENMNGLIIGNNSKKDGNNSKLSSAIKTNVNGNMLIDSFIKKNESPVTIHNFVNSNICLNFTYNNKSEDRITKALSLPVLFPIPSNIILSKNNKMASLQDSLIQHTSTKKLIDSYFLPNKENIEKKEVIIDQEKIDNVLSTIMQTPNSVKSLNSLIKPPNEYNYCLYSDTVRGYWNAVLQKKNNKHLPKFPIDDTELYNFPDLYNITEYNISKPSGKIINLIPQNCFGDLIQIFDFIQTFSSHLLISKFTLKELYAALKLSEEHYDYNIPLINEIYCSLIKVLLRKIQSMQLNDLHINMDEDLMMIKIIIDNISKSDYNKFISMTWIELMRLIFSSHIFSQYTIDIQIQKKLKGITVLNFYREITYEEKMSLLKALVVNCYETDFIREIIKEEQEKRNSIRKNKRDLEEEMRMTDSRKRELERQEKFTQPQLKIEQITKKLLTLSEDNPTMTRHQLSRLRKELEHEREQFKSVIKEIDTIENRRIDILNKIEKIQNEIYDIPTMNKKFIGSDGRGHKYFFFQWENDKIYIKIQKKMGDTNNKYEWREFTEENDIKELSQKLSEKGIKENTLKNKIKKLYPKRMNFSNSNESQDNLLSIFTNQSLKYNNTFHKEEHSSSALKYYLSNEKFEDTKDYQIIAEQLLSLEESITEYLSNDKKEWESFEIRNNIKAWLSCINSIPQYINVLLLFNERNKSPYKSNAFQQNSHIITDDDEVTTQFSPIDINGILNPYLTNPNEVLANKTKLWSRDFENYALEDLFIQYLHEVTSFQMILFGIFIFTAVCIDLGKRRDYYKKKNEELIEEATKIDNYKVNSNTKESEKDNKSDEMELDIESEQNNIDEEYTTTNKYSSKLRKSTVNQFSTNDKEKKKYIEWNETCMKCGDFGELICCEDCPNVTHLKCAGLRKEPEIWRCQNCNYKLANRRITRSNANK